jgi:hypothetical protein
MIQASPWERFKPCLRPSASGSASSANIVEVLNTRCVARRRAPRSARSGQRARARRLSP